MYVLFEVNFFFLTIKTCQKIEESAEKGRQGTRSANYDKLEEISEGFDQFETITTNL
jgi:hypothetical protein